MVFQYMKRSESSQNNSVKHAIMVLEYLATLDYPQDLAVISKALNMNKSTVYRLLSTLRESNFVYQDEDNKKYSLGAIVTWLSAKYLEKNEVRKVARPLLETFSRQIGETVHLGILDGVEVTYIDKINGQSAVVMASVIGERVPVHCTALGKALMAYQPENKWHEYVEQCGLPARTPQTITTPEPFYTELRKIRDQGFALDDIENEEGIRCVAAVIFDAHDHAVAAVSVSSWIITMTMEHVQTIIPILKETTGAISAYLGQHKS
jgi:IclR family acetate operon transcriptional repressor